MNSNMTKNFKKKSKLRCMMNGGSLTDPEYMTNEAPVISPTPSPAPSLSPDSLGSGAASEAAEKMLDRLHAIDEYAHGGGVRGPGGPTDDKVGPVMLSDGEYVLPADTVKAVGKKNLDRLRNATHTFVAAEEDGMVNGGEFLDRIKEGATRFGGAVKAGYQNTVAPTVESIAARAKPAVDSVGNAFKNPETGQTIKRGVDSAIDAAGRFGGKVTGGLRDLLGSRAAQNTATQAGYAADDVADVARKAGEAANNKASTWTWKGLKEKIPGLGTGATPEAAAGGGASGRGGGGGRGAAFRGAGAAAAGGGGGGGGAGGGGSGSTLRSLADKAGGIGNAIMKNKLASGLVKYGGGALSLAGATSDAMDAKEAFDQKDLSGQLMGGYKSGKALLGAAGSKYAPAALAYGAITGAEELSDSTGLRGRLADSLEFIGGGTDVGPLNFEKGKPVLPGQQPAGQAEPPPTDTTPYARQGNSFSNTGEFLPVAPLQPTSLRGATPVGETAISNEGELAKIMAMRASEPAATPNVSQAMTRADLQKELAGVDDRFGKVRYTLRDGFRRGSAGNWSRARGEVINNYIDSVNNSNRAIVDAANNANTNKTLRQNNQDDNLARLQERQLDATLRGVRDNTLDAFAKEANLIAGGDEKVVSEINTLIKSDPKLSQDVLNARGKDREILMNLVATKYLPIARQLTAQNKGVLPPDLNWDEIGLREGNITDYLTNQGGGMSLSDTFNLPLPGTAGAYEGAGMVIDAGGNRFYSASDLPPATIANYRNRK